MNSIDDCEWLHDQYITQGKTATLMGKEQGVSNVTIINRLKKFGIERIHEGGSFKRPGVNYTFLEDSSWLRHHYIDLNQTTREIATQCGCSSVTVVQYLKKAKLNDMKRKGPFVSEESLSVLKSPEKLQELYLKQQLTAKEIGDQLKVHDSTVNRYLSLSGIEPRFNYKASTHERSLLDTVKSWNPSLEVVTHTRKVIHPLELDFYFPQQKLAIEINGVYWHSEKFKPQNYHAFKYEECQKQGVQLLQFTDSQYKNKKLIVEGMIKTKLGLHSTTLGARQCKIDYNPVKKEVADFLNTYHIQGARSYSSATTLLFNNEIVACACYIRREEEVYELVRFCSIGVQGAFTRLVKHSPKGKIITFLDLMTGNDRSNLYLSNGFEEKKRLQPDYQYVVGENLRHKFSFRKKALAKLGAIGGTEKEKAASLGFLRYYDAGKIRYELDNR